MAALYPANGQRLNLSLPAPQTTLYFTMYGVATEVAAPWLMFIRRQLRLQRLLNVLNVGLMTRP